jgi:hypothetical protein
MVLQLLWLFLPQQETHKGQQHIRNNYTSQGVN